MLKPNAFEGNVIRDGITGVCYGWPVHCYVVSEPRAVGPHTSEEKLVFHDADTMFKEAIINMLGDTIVDAYMWFPAWKEKWDALEDKYGVSDASCERIWWSRQIIMRETLLLLKHKGGEKRVQTKCISEVRRRDHPLMGSAVDHPLLLSSCAFQLPKYSYAHNQIDEIKRAWLIHVEQSKFYFSN